MTETQGSKLLAWLGGIALMLVGPPLTWLAILWSNPTAAGLRAPVLVYGLAALAAVPGIVGLWMLPVRWGTKWLILPLYLVVMAAAMLVTLVYFVCIATHDCP